MRRTMIRRHPLDIKPELPNIEERPLDLNEVKKQYLKV